MLSDMILVLSLSISIRGAIPNLSPQHSIPINPNLIQKLPNHYQLLVGGQPGRFHIFDYDTQSKSFQNITTSSDLGTGPSWIEFDQTGNYMFNSDATSSYANLNNTGGVYSSKIDRNGKVKVISSSPTGPQPVRIALDQKAHNLILGTYNGATVERFSIHPLTRELSKQPIQSFHFIGQSLNPTRQTKSYIHDVQFTPDYSQVIAVDLGTDRLRRFEVESDGNLKKLDDVQTPPGCGPRHLAWASRQDKNLLDAYVICSLTRTLLNFEVEISSGHRFTPRGQPRSIEPRKALERESLEGSEVLISPDGRFVITSTTQTSSNLTFLPDNILTSFPRNPQTGSLSSEVTVIPTGGSVPRQFALDPTGSLIAVGHQGTDEVMIFERDLETGNAQPIAKVPSERASFAVWRSIH